MSDKKSIVFKDQDLIYCSGCFHGTINRLLAETISDLRLKNSVIGVNSQGCGGFIADYLDIDFLEAPPGQAPLVAVGIKNVLPEKVIFTYQGDGDTLAFGLDALIHSANRGEKITVIMVNNLVMAQSGGQMSPTSFIGQLTQTTPYGRSVEKSGKQIRIPEILSELPGSAYVSRVSVGTPEQVKAAKEALRDAFEIQLEGRGFSFIEFLSICPTYWEKDPLTSRKFLEEKLIYDFPLGLLKKNKQK